MQLFHLVNGHKPREIDPQAPLPDTGFIWADFVRDDARDWQGWVCRQLGLDIEPHHVEDSLNATHPSFFDGTADYDMLVFEGLGPRDEPFPIETRVAVFFMFDRALVTVRAMDNISLLRVRDRLLDGRLKPPSSAMRLAHLVVDTMVDRYLNIRAPMDEALTQLQDSLLDPGDSRREWRDLLEGRREARRLQALCENQRDALDAWRRDTRFDWSRSDEVRYKDLVDHVGRLLSHAESQERDLESAVQLHFAAMAHQTNRVMQTLTVLAAIFFPLTFIVGVYGMNFENMPELHWRYGYFIVLGLLGGIAVSLTLYFRRKRLL